MDRPDELRLDLDPQPGTSFTDAVRVAGVARELLEELGLRGYAKTSGNRGIHIFVRIEPRWEFLDVRHAAIGFGRELARRDSGVTVDWWKEERGERIFIDFNQNCRDRTIASAYSLRPIVGAPVSTPLTWEELAEVTDPREFNLFTVPERLAASGDAWATIDDTAYSLEPLLALYDELPGGEMPFPPDYPKMPGEPPRVQPSKKVEEHWDAAATGSGRRESGAGARARRGGGARRGLPRVLPRHRRREGALAARRRARRPLVPSGWTPLELVRHLAFMERRWFVWGFLGEQAADPWGDSQGRVRPAWLVPASVSLDDVVALLAEQAARTEAVLSSTPLDQLAATTGRFRTDPPDLRYICFHVLQEYARHAGHLDVAVELAGGPVGE